MAQHNQPIATLFPNERRDIAHYTPEGVCALSAERDAGTVGVPECGRWPEGCGLNVSAMNVRDHPSLSLTGDPSPDPSCPG